jgi:hypothetical protein
VEAPKPLTEDWSAMMSRRARELMGTWSGDPALLDSDPVQALTWLEARLAQSEASGCTQEQLRLTAAHVMAFLGEVIIGLHGAHWATYPVASPPDRHVLQGGRLRAPVRMGPLVLRAFRVPCVSVVAMLSEAELEARIHVAPGAFAPSGSRSVRDAGRGAAGAFDCTRARLN